jgi:hypothetical protein
MLVYVDKTLSLYSMDGYCESDNIIDIKAFGTGFFDDSHITFPDSIEHLSKYTLRVDSLVTQFNGIKDGSYCFATTNIDGLVLWQKV